MDRCECCGLRYDELKTGHTFASVREMMFVGTDDTTQWRQKGRRSVLGFWRELKQQAWKYHLDLCQWASQSEAA